MFWPENPSMFLFVDHYIRSFIDAIINNNVIIVI